MESKALAVVRPDSGPSFAVGDVRQMAEAAAQSGLFSAIKTKEAAFTLMMLCQAEGLHPMQALRRFDIIQGRPAMKADAILAEFQARGGRVKWVKNEIDCCEAVFTSPGMDGPVAVKWTMEDAKRANLGGKDTWRAYPRQMLRARVISEGVRLSMPGVVVGLYTPEEVGDFGEAPPPAPKAQHRVTSAEAPIAGEYAPPPSEVPLQGNHVPEDAPWYEKNPAKMRRLQAAVAKLNLGKAASEGLKGKERETVVREARIEYLRWATGRDDVNSTHDLHDEDADRVLQKAEAGELQS